MELPQAQRRCQVNDAASLTAMNREQFAEHWGKFGHYDSPLWVPEERIGQKCESFVYLSFSGSMRNPLSYPGLWDDFWPWCQKHLQGQVTCFSWNNDGSWWGLTDAADTVLFVLRWS